MHLEKQKEECIHSKYSKELQPYLKLNQIYNTACGDQISLNEMISSLNEISGKNITPVYGPERQGDVKHSNADIAKIKRLLDYKPEVFFREGLQEVYSWYEESKVLS